MRFLLDTHVMLWWLFDSSKLSQNHRQIIAEPTNQILISSASAWEIATKFRLGKMPEAETLISDFSGRMNEARFEELPISIEHALRAGTWVNEHKDPFDRMFAAQSAVEAIPLCSSDAIFERFGIGLIR